MEAKQFAVVFDLDGTLVNSLPDICGVLNEARKHFQLELLPLDTIQKAIGKGPEELVKSCFAEIINQIEAKEILHQFGRLYLKNPSHGGHVYPGVIDALTSFNKNPQVKVGIATNKHQKMAERTIEHYFPSIRFDAIFGADKVTQRKPHANHLLETLQALGIPPENALFVGDDKVDQLCAKDAKVKFFGALYGFGGVVVEQGVGLQSFSELLNHLPFVV